MQILIWKIPGNASDSDFNKLLGNVDAAPHRLCGPQGYKGAKKIPVFV